MTDHAPLTDEELAQIKQWIDDNYSPFLSTGPGRNLRRLIVDLRAERAGSNALWRRNNELHAEVERLKAENAQLREVDS